MDTATTTPGWTDQAGAAFAAAIDVAVEPLTVASARSLRAHARRYAALCEGADLDPLDPEPSALRGALDEAGLREGIRSKCLWAARRAACAVPAATPGRTGPYGGSTRALVDDLPPGPLSAAVAAVLDDAGARASVVRSAIGRLLEWAARSGIDPLELSAPDVDEFADWLRAVYGRVTGEYLVVARRLCRALDGAVGDAGAP